MSLLPVSWLTCWVYDCHILDYIDGARILLILSKIKFRSKYIDQYLILYIMGDFLISYDHGARENCNTA